MGIFGKRAMKCARCHSTLHDHSEEYVRECSPALVGETLRGTLHVTCSSCGRNYCVRCMENGGSCLSDRGGRSPGMVLVLWCTGGRHEMDVDLPAAHPSLKSMMMQAYPDLSAAQLEALTRLTSQPLGEATYAIRGFLSDKDFPGFVEKVKTIEPDLAEYLRLRSPPRIRIDQLTFPSHTA